MPWWRVIAQHGWSAILTGTLVTTAVVVMVLTLMRGAPTVPSSETAVTADAPPAPDRGYVSLLPLANDQFSIVEMATAHGAFTIEVEIAAGADTGSIAEGLIEPVQDRYAEVLVYFYDRESDNALPRSRIQWTADGGYSELEY